MKIRPATPTGTDARASFDLLQEMHTSFEPPQLSFDPMRVLLKVGECIDQGAIFLLCDPEPQGLIAITESAPWWSSESALMEVAFFIRPAYRTFAGASGLLDAAILYAKIEGKPLHFGLYTGEDRDRKSVLLKRKGFRTAGISFIWEPTNHVVLRGRG